MQIAGILSRSKAQYLAATSFFTNYHPILSRSLGSSRTPHLVSPSPLQSTISNIFRPTSGCERAYHNGRPRGSLWRGKKQIGKEALFVILGMKRFKDDGEKLDKFIKTHVLRLLKLDMVVILNELERQGEVSLAVKMFTVIRKQDWYKPDVYLYKDLIVALARRKKMDDAMALWQNMREEDLFPDSQTYTEVIHGFLQYGSPADAMNIYEDMKKYPDLPEQLPFRILLKGLLLFALVEEQGQTGF